MTNNTFDELIEIARRMGIVVRHAALGGGGGGLVSLKGQRQLFIDLNASPADQLEQTARALSRLTELETLYLRPDVRTLLEEAGDHSSVGNAASRAALHHDDHPTIHH